MRHLVLAIAFTSSLPLCAMDNREYVPELKRILGHNEEFIRCLNGQAASLSPFKGEARVVTSTPANYNKSILYILATQLQRNIFLKEIKSEDKSVEGGYSVDNIIDIDSEYTNLTSDTMKKLTPDDISYIETVFGMKPFSKTTIIIPNYQPEISSAQPIDNAFSDISNSDE